MDIDKPQELVPNTTPRWFLNRQRRKQKRNRVGMVVMGAGLVLTVGGAGSAIYTGWKAFEPEYIPPAIATLDPGEGTEASYPVDENGEIIPPVPQKPGEMPEIALSDKKGVRELDRCTGKFVELDAYNIVPGLQTTYAAHNHCGGDAILKLRPGNKLYIDGVEYKVVSERALLKKGSKASELVGMDGQIILQSCFYNSKYMHFIGVEPVLKKTDA